MVAVGLDTSALDESFKAHAGRGTGRYVRELQRYFASAACDDLEVVPFRPHAAPSPGAIDRCVELLPFGRVTMRQQVLFPMRLSNRSWVRRTIGKEVDAIHFPAHIDAPSWAGRRYIVTVLDLIPVIFADLYAADRPGWRFRLARSLELRAIRNADLVLAISDNTARDVNRILSVPRERIVVTPLGVDEGYFAAERVSDDPELRQRLGIEPERPIVLYVGGIDQRKNMRRLLSAFRAVRTRFEMRRPEPPPLLVLAGGIQRDNQYPQLLARIRELELERDVRCTGYVEEQDLIRLYGLSRVFFFPSLYEGFGLPPLEAMAAGTPVVSSNASAMPEVLGDAALLFDPADADAAAEQLEAVLTDSSLANRLSEMGRTQAKKFSWDRTGQLTLDAYRSFLQGRRHAA